jgi:hypothetical protein
MWYPRMTREAIRKHALNADLHIHSLDDAQTGQDAAEEVQRPHLLDILGSAIVKGLDIVGIVSRNNFWPGQLAGQIAKERSYDITCLAGVEAKSAEGVHCIVYNATTVPTQGEPLTNICRRAHREGGIVMAIQPSRRNTQRMNHVAGSEAAPDMIEIFNDQTLGGYSKAFVDTGPDEAFLLVMNSAARNARDLDESKMMSKIPRKFLVERNILGDEEGVDYTPPYLRRQDPFSTGEVAQPWATAPTQM